MSEQISVLVLVIALAAGLVTTFLLSSRVREYRADGLHFLLAHLLLFNLLILAGLVLRYLQMQDSEELTDIYLEFLPVLLSLLAALKIAWMAVYVGMARVLASGSTNAAQTIALQRTGISVFVVFLVLMSADRFLPDANLAQAAVMALEMLVLTVVLAASVGLALKAWQLPSGGRRKSLTLFAAFHAGFFATIAGLLVIGWLTPGPQQSCQILINSSLLALFNLFPLLWLRLYPVRTDDGLIKRFKALGITAREQQIVELIQSGKTNQEIADQLFISLATIKDHNHNIFRKCGVRNRLELSNLFR
jgi:DNA-binding CsgD family transcriptional regulator